MKFGHLSTILNADGLIATPAFCIALKYAFKVIVILCAVFLILTVSSSIILFLKYKLPNSATEITEKTRQAFIDVFCELYSQKPIEKISVQDIANKAGYNRSTFYQHFPDIYELLDSVESDLLTYMKEELTNMKKSTASIQNALNCIENSKHISVLKALLGDYGSVHFLERLKREIPFDGLDLNFQEYDFLKPYLIEFYISTSLSLFRLWIKQEKDLSSEEFFKLVDTLYKNGITPYSKK